MKVFDFDLEQTLECGQCFNFEKIGHEEYIVTAYERMLHIKQTGDELVFLNASDTEAEKIWIPYFDLGRDYGIIKNEIVKADYRLKPIVEQYYGIHILNQEFTETLISFIISQNNNIPRIKGIIRKLSESCGRVIGTYPDSDLQRLNGKSGLQDIPVAGTSAQDSLLMPGQSGSLMSDNKQPVYSFPGLEKLGAMTEQDFKNLKTGFRAAYLCDAISKMKQGLINGNELKDMSFQEAKAKLMTIKGVGDKVANCVLLFGLGFRNAFPVDVWIKRVMEDLYFHENTDKAVIEKFAVEKFGQYGGYAQQYLFIYARNNSL